MAHPATLGEALRDVDRAMLISSSDPTMLEVQSNFIDAARRRASARRQALRHHAGPRLPLSIRSDARRDRATAGSLGDGVHASARRRVHACVLPAGAVDRRPRKAAAAHGGRSDRVDRRRRHCRGRRHRPDRLGHVGASYPLTGPEALSMAEVAGKLSAATGNRIEYVNVAPEQATSAQLAAGMPPFTAEALAELFAERRKGKEAQVSPLVQTILGRPATSFDEFAMRQCRDLPRRATGTESLTSRDGLPRPRSGFHGDPGGADEEADCALRDSIHVELGGVLAHRILVCSAPLVRTATGALAPTWSPHPWPARSCCPRWRATSPANPPRRAVPGSPGGAARTPRPWPLRSAAARPSRVSRSPAPGLGAGAKGWRCGP